jgi:carboxyl-terminal processing protease
MNNLSRIGSVTTLALSLSFAGAAFANDNDAANDIVNNALDTTITITEDDVSLTREIYSRCAFYVNVLNAFDANHISGVLQTPQSEVAEAALEGVLRGVFRTTDYIDAVSIDSDDEENYFATFTFANGMSYTIEDASNNFDHYSDSCAYMQAPLDIIASQTDQSVTQLFDYALNGVIRATRDPHSSYLGADAMADMRERTSGQFGGLGVQITSENGYIKVIEPNEDGPGDRAGILENDLITHIDGVHIQGMDLSDAIDFLKGEPQTEVTITIQRDDAAPFDIDVTREIIRVPSVEHVLLGDTLHVTVSSFGENTYPEFVEAIGAGMAEYASERAMNLQKLVIDVRGNGGGLLSAVLPMIDRLIQTSDGAAQQQIMGTGPNAANLEDVFINDEMVPVNFPNFNITVLVDERSASASEILAGALMDEGVEIIGRQSYGKGSVQTIMPITDSGNLARFRSDEIVGAARVTTSVFFPGSTVLSNQGSGIHPTVKVMYGDFRDDFHENARHESDIDSAMLPAGETRAHIVPQYVCTLNPDLAGAISDETLSELAFEFSMMVAESFTGPQTNADWERFQSTPEFQDLVAEYNEYISEYTIRYYTAPEVEGGLPQLNRYMDADRLCAQHRMDGAQEITINGNPVTTIEPILQETQDDDDAEQDRAALQPLLRGPSMP